MIVCRNGQRQAEEIGQSRALQYGDGHFTSMRVTGGRVVWWPAHCRRLREGNRRLHLPAFDETMLGAEVDALAAEIGEGSIKVLLTRSSGQRGYRLGADIQAERWLIAEAGPIRAAVPLRMRICTLRLARQPALAGLKTLNRLEQVLARAEWSDDRRDEGVLLDTREHVVSAISANLFVRCQGRWLTPDLAEAGVAGVCRAMIMARTPVDVVALSVHQLMQAEEIFCCNAVRGIMPVASIEAQAFSLGQATRALMADIQMELGILA